MPSSGRCDTTSVIFDIGKEKRLYVCCADRCLSFCPFLLAIVLSVLLFTDADYPFVISNLFSLPMSKITDVVSHLPDDGMLIISHITITDTGALAH
jgi:hypothetical protein